MIIDRLINFIARKACKDKDAQEDLVGGLISGLIAGLIVGLGVGLIAGLGAGLGVGLIAGLGSFILDAGMLPSFVPYLILTGIAVLAEIMFWKDKKKPGTKESKWGFTIKRKLVAYAESSYTVSLAIGGYQLCTKGAPFLSDFLGQYGQTIMGVVGWGTAIALVLVGYVWLNSLKYRKAK